MSLIVLLITLSVALLLSNAVDAVPGLITSWLFVPRWLFWGSLLALVAWCMKREDAA